VALNGVYEFRLRMVLRDSDPVPSGGHNGVGPVAGPVRVDGARSRDLTAMLYFSGRGGTTRFLFLLLR